VSILLSHPVLQFLAGFAIMFVFMAFVVIVGVTGDAPGCATATIGLAVLMAIGNFSTSKSLGVGSLIGVPLGVIGALALFSRPRNERTRNREPRQRWTKHASQPSG